MNDRMKESLSALCDGECDELEVRRVLNQISGDPELRDEWHRYHLMGALMRDEPVSTVDLSKGIMQALDGLPMDDLPVQAGDEGHANGVINHLEGQHGSVSQPSISQWFVSGAVAASVTLAVLVGARLMTDTTVSTAQVLAERETKADTQPVVSTPQGATMLAASADAEMTSEQVSPEALRDAQEVLRQYVLEHAEGPMVSSEQAVKPYARVASFGKESKTAPAK